MPLDAMVQVLRTIPRKSKTLFAQAYPGEAISEKTVARAIATFERTVVSGQAPFDKWISGGTKTPSARTPNAASICSTARPAARNVIPSGTSPTMDSTTLDWSTATAGARERLPLEGMQFAFKTPTLRNVDRRAPYMHEGNEQTLAEVIDFYDRGGDARRKSLSPEMVPLRLTSQEKTDLLAFLSTLTSVDKPVEFPIFPR